MIINTMLVGHVVTAKVLKNENGTFTCAFLHHTESGAKRLCLDLGQNWVVDSGYEFTCTQVQIDRAAYWMGQPASDSLDWTAADIARIMAKV
jgi:hypothetical protein